LQLSIQGKPKLTHLLPTEARDPNGKRDAIDYARGRFGGSRGEIHVYCDDGSTIERSIVIDGRGQYPQSAGE